MHIQFNSIHSSLTTCVQTPPSDCASWPHSGRWVTIHILYTTYIYCIHSIQLLYTCTVILLYDIICIMQRAYNGMDAECCTSTSAMRIGIGIVLVIVLSRNAAQSSGCAAPGAHDQRARSRARRSLVQRVRHPTGYRIRRRHCDPRLLHSRRAAHCRIQPGRRSVSPAAPLPSHPLIVQY